MIDNLASLCNSTDTIATFITDSVDLMLELEIRKIAPEKVVGVLPMMAHTEDSSIGRPRLRVLYRTSHAGIPIQTAHNDQFYWVVSIIGVIASLVVGDLFPQTRDHFIISFAGWLRLCLYVGGLLDNNRTYGAVVAGYAVAQALGPQIDSPRTFFLAGVNRGAAIVPGSTAFAPAKRPVRGSQLNWQAHFAWSACLGLYFTLCDNLTFQF
jgi:Fusaric acid resistance protein family